MWTRTWSGQLVKIFKLNIFFLTTNQHQSTQNNRKQAIEFGYAPLSLEVVDFLIKMWLI